MTSSLGSCKSTFIQTFDPQTINFDDSFSTLCQWQSCPRSFTILSVGMAARSQFMGRRHSVSRLLLTTCVKPFGICFHFDCSQKSISVSETALLVHQSRDNRQRSTDLTLRKTTGLKRPSLVDKSMLAETELIVEELSTIDSTPTMLRQLSQSQGTTKVIIRASASLEQSPYVKAPE